MKMKAILKKMTPALKAAYVFQRMNFYILKSYIAKDIVAIKKRWAQELLQILNSEVKVIGTPVQKGPLLLLGNHISYADIPVIMSVVPAVSFLSKQEIARWPIIGTATRRAHTVFVKRGSPESRAESKKIIENSLTKNHSIIAAFPAGTTSLQETIPWRYGLFETAFQKKIKVQPFRIRYTPMREVAYIDDDEFLLHLHNLAQLKKIKAEIEFHEPVEIIDPVACSQKWQAWTQEFLST